LLALVEQISFIDYGNHWTLGLFYMLEHQLVFFCPPVGFKQKQRKIYIGDYRRRRTNHIAVDRPSTRGRVYTGRINVNCLSVAIGINAQQVVPGGLGFA